VASEKDNNSFQKRNKKKKSFNQMITDAKSFTKPNPSCSKTPNPLCRFGAQR